MAGKRCVKSILAFGAKPLVKGAHPTEKPEKIYRWLIERYCPPGGTILDPTAGSFNSCFTAYEMGRSAIGIEKDDGFFKKASQKADSLVPQSSGQAEHPEVSPISGAAGQVPDMSRITPASPAPASPESG